MCEVVNLGIGFVTGRPNVCRIINSYYKNMLEQIKLYNKECKITIFVLYDLSYQYTKRTDFYNLIPDVYKNIKIKYITPEDIEEEKKKVISRYSFSKKEAELIFGHGHAKGRNTLMYYALKENIDYLLFWDDDEYPVAVLKDEDKNLKWEKQNNIFEHLKHIENSDVTIGHHCGYISPIPYIDVENQIAEEDFKNFIESISNDIINWDNIKEKFNKDNGVTFAKKEIMENGAFEIKGDGVGKWVAGSTLCLNLTHIDKIPAFYNPEGARGEDTFFSTMLNNSTVKRIPTYHFHDGFLKYTNIMKEKYPKVLRKISTEEDISTRFLQASLGWIKYKPLFMYITNREEYKENINIIKEKLEKSIPKIDMLFHTANFKSVIVALQDADNNVKKHYKEYLETNNVWNRLKECIINEQYEEEEKSN